MKRLRQEVIEAVKLVVGQMHRHHDKVRRLDRPIAKGTHAWVRVDNHIPAPPLPCPQKEHIRDKPPRPHDVPRRVGRSTSECAEDLATRLDAIGVAPFVRSR